LNGLEEHDFDVIFKKIAGLRPIAESLGASPAQLAIAWATLNKDVSSVILGASRPDQVTENVKALALVPKLDKEIVASIEKVLDNAPQPVRSARWNMGFNPYN